MGRKRLAKNRGFPPNLYLNSAGYYYFINPISKKTKGLGREKAHAFSEARAANAALEAMRPSSLADWVSGKSDYTLAEWCPLYKDLWLSKAKTDPAPATMRACTMYLKRIVGAEFAWMKLRDITTAHVAAFVIVVENESGAPTAISLRSRLSDVFRMAETQGLIDQGKNPVSATYVPSRDVKRERLTIEQFKAIHDKAPIWLQRAMYVALLTAQRRDDIANMKFSDCKDGFLYVIQGKGRGTVRLQQDINIRISKIDLSIGDVIQNCRDLVVSRHMIHHVSHEYKVKPGDQVSSTGMSNGFQRARDAAGIVAAEGRTPPSFHEIRSLAERLYREEYGAEFAQAMLGHKHASMTAKYEDLRGQGWQLVAAGGGKIS